MHVLPRVGELHQRFPDVLEVIGVHAGKFVTERRTERIADACVRLGVHHPVVNDRQFRVWREYGVRAWPTVALIDPEGYLVAIQAGEVTVEAVATLIDKTVQRAQKRGTLRRGPSIASRPSPGVQPAELRFPTRALLQGSTLWISDTGNGRVLECEWSAEDTSAVVRREYAGFEEPRGLAVLGNSLAVADRRAQTIWRLRDGSREPLAGTGSLADHAVEEGSPATSLRSPWGLVADGDALVIAMAGSHELWTLDEARGLRKLAGRGAEEIVDGPALDALLAQPTGVSLNASSPSPSPSPSPTPSPTPSRPPTGPLLSAALAFADCETSAVRLLDGERVATVVGTDLFEFGDRAGVADDARLQHCEDVAWHGDSIVVADTYNDRLKLADPVTRECVPWVGEAGEAGALREPGGVFSDGRTILVSDTGSHRLVRVEADGSLTKVRLA